MRRTPNADEVERASLRVPYCGGVLLSIREKAMYCWRCSSHSALFDV